MRHAQPAAVAVADSHAIKLSDFKNGLAHVLGTGCKENSSFRGVPMKNFFIGWSINTV